MSRNVENAESHCKDSINRIEQLANQLASAADFDAVWTNRQSLVPQLSELNFLLTESKVVSNAQVQKAIAETNILSHLVDLAIGMLAADKLFESPGDEITFCILSTFLNATNWSLEFCSSLSQQEKFFKIFYPKLLTGQDAKEQPTQGERSRSIYYTLAIAFNCYFKNDSEIFSRLSEFELVEYAKPYLECKELRTSTVALILIAFAVDEKQSDIFLGAKENIAFLISVLKNALKMAGRNWKGYDALEAAKCIKRLALNDANKDLLIELNLLPVVQQMLSSSNDEDVAEGIEILFTLSFSKKNAAKIRSDFMESIRQLKAVKKWSESKQLQGLEFHLQEQATAPPRPPSAAAGRQLRRVMISYNHANRPLVEKLYQMLVEAKLDVWVDFKDMKAGSVYQAMASGIEGSSVVLMCVTRLYNESSNCRLEVEYAHECGKKLIPLLMEPKYRPNGWLGLLTRAELRYDLTGTKCPFEQKVTELLDALRGFLADNGGGGRPSSSSASATRAQQPLPPIASASVVASPSTSSPLHQNPHHHGNPHQNHHQHVKHPSVALRSWDADRVAAWCREKRLPEWITDRRMVGLELQFLVNSLARSPEYFGRLLEAHFGCQKLLDLATFVAALEDLLPKQ